MEKEHSGVGDKKEWSNLVRRAYNATEDIEQSTAAAVALSEIGVYFDAARRQIERLRLCFEASRKAAVMEDRIDPDATEVAAVDAHFYFVSWHRIERMIHLLGTRGGSVAARGVYTRHRELLLRHAEARHHITHLEDRLPGRPKEKLVSPGDGTWMFGTIVPVLGLYRIGKETYDLSTVGLARLQEIVAELQVEVSAELPDLEPSVEGNW
ncbi:MAG: hypothetical protein M3Q10_11695 [Chloroflexota bacterium]|nr:hypothetical protein [Chloroflexota bacterium]